jgi:hypothetical protein
MFIKKYLLICDPKHNVHKLLPLDSSMSQSNAFYTFTNYVYNVM